MKKFIIFAVLFCTLYFSANYFYNKHTEEVELKTERVLTFIVYTRSLANLAISFKTETLEWFGLEHTSDFSQQQIVDNQKVVDICSLHEEKSKTKIITCTKLKRFITDLKKQAQNI